ncbi:MAG: hypothetical protein JST00_20185 [Deltaproteobacteria bacterium]|nr:hypothetical protein [Deltaproteobacteria bacterium]
MRRWLWVAVASASSLASSLAACSDDPAAPEADSGAVEAGPGDASITSDASDASPSDADAEAGPRLCSDDGFCHLSLPEPETLRGVWGESAKSVWAVSEEGHVLRWDGGAWKVVARDLGKLYAIWGSGGGSAPGGAPPALWLGGERGLFESTGASSAALTFRSVATPGGVGIPILSIWGQSKSDVWAVGSTLDEAGAPRSKVLRYRSPTPDAGASWAVDPVSSQPWAFTKVWGTPAAGVWIGGDEGGDFPFAGAVYRRGPSSASFVRAPLPYDPLARDAGDIQRFTAGGVAGDRDLYVFGTSPASGALWRGVSSDGGVVAWTFEERDLNDLSIRAVSGLSPSAVWAVGDYGRLRRSDGGPFEQAAIKTGTFPVTAPLYALWTAPGAGLWVVGKQVALYKENP